jgi:hypothetical protein
MSDNILKRDSQLRKCIVTINNFLQHGYTRETLREKITALKSLVYFCAAEEKGIKCGTHHIHIYIAFSSGVRFSTIKNVFNLGGDIKSARGTSSENRDYIGKTGKWEDDPKADTRIDGTFEEWGEMPKEHQGVTSVYADILHMVENDYTLDDIRQKHPSEYFVHNEKIRRLQQEHVKSNLPITRPMEVTYIFGEPNTGKSYHVRTTYGKDVYVAFAHDKNMFDGYVGQAVLCIDEFLGQLPITYMNAILDVYPLELSARYHNRTALYEKVILISNVKLNKQYVDIQRSSPELWRAFTRRIHKVIEFLPGYKQREHDIQEHLSGVVPWEELPDDTPTPWDDMGGAG